MTAPPDTHQESGRYTKEDWSFRDNSTIHFVSGLGIGIIYVPGVSIVSYLDEGRTAANGIASSGHGLGVFVMSYIVPIAIEKYHWRGSMFIMSGVALHYCVLGALMRTPDVWKRLKQQEKLTKNDSRRTAVSKFGFHIYKNPDVVLYLIQYFTHCFGLSLSFVHVSAMAKSLGATEKMASLPVSILGITGVIGRMSSGLIGQIGRVDTFLFYLLSTFLAGLSAILFPFVRSYYSIVTWSVCYGLLSSPANSLSQILMLFLVDICDLNAAVTHLTLMVAVGMLFGGIASGWIYDITQDYAVSFRLGGAIIIVGCLLIVWPYIKHKRGQSSLGTSEIIEVKKVASFSSVFGSGSLVMSRSDVRQSGTAAKNNED